MSSPQSTTAGEGVTAEARKFEQITFRFCSECSNMLYPKEDADAHQLQFTCRTCQYTEPAQSSCVFRNVLNNTSGETAGVTQDVASDPTVSGSLVSCLHCGHIEHCLSHRPEKKEEEAGLVEMMGLWLEDPFEEYDEELMESAEESAEETASEGDATSDERPTT